MTKTLTEMMTEVVDFCHAKGWSGPGSVEKSRGDCYALLQSEASEALEAYRDCGETDEAWFTYTIEIEHMKFKELTNLQVEALTGRTPEDLELEGKPEGVGPELADVFIRWLDDADRFGHDMSDHPRMGPTLMMKEAKTFGDMIDALQVTIASASECHQKSGQIHDTWFRRIYLDLAYMCARLDLDLEFEYERKMAHNLNRPYRHGGKRL